MIIFNKYLVVFFLIYTAVFFTSCDENLISPANQQVAFVKYYGHVSDQTSNDLKKTADGGYIMLGSTNSFNGEDEHDVYVVKTDALGNEMWSASIGKTPTGNNLKYDEEGVSVVILPDDAGYLLACNRTYIQYSTSGDPPAPLYNKIVLYQLDAAGVNISGPDGVELQSNVTIPSNLPNGGAISTEKVSDMILDTIGGTISYVLTGFTNNISITKPDPYPDKRYDLTDIFTIRLNESFVQLWASGNLHYGFNGRDYGTSIQVVDDNDPNTDPWYVVVGTTENEWDQLTGNFTFRNIAVKLDKASGTPTNPTYYGDASRSFEDGHSILNTANNHLIIAASCVVGAEAGSLTLFEVDENLVLQGGFVYYRPTDLVSGVDQSENTYHAAAIDILPESKGYIISTNHKKSATEHDICIMQVDATLSEQWSKFFGYNNSQSSFSTLEEAGAIIAVTEQVEGTSTAQLDGIAFTGTFGMATNNMMGLVKLNTNGDLKPE